MSWQDELQHLDAELAAGRISAEEYRNKRDALSQVGAAASGTGTQDASGAGAQAAGDQQPPATQEQPPAAQGETPAAQSGTGGEEQAATGAEGTVQREQPAFPSEEPPASQPAAQQAAGDEPTVQNQPALSPEGQQPPSQPGAQQTGQQAGADQSAGPNQQAIPAEGQQAPQPPNPPAAGTGPHSIDSSTTDPGVSGNFAGQDAPGHAAQPQSPFPPAFSWNAVSNQQPQQPNQPQAPQSQTPQPQAPEEMTQVVPNVVAQTGSAPAQPPSDAEQTQTVNINQIAQHQPHQPPPQPPQNPAGSLGQQLNPQTGPSPMPPAAPHPQQQVWPDMQGQSNHGWGSSSGTPWDESELPPAPEQNEPSWMRQGPEVFETAGQKSGKGKWIGISIGAVVLVGAIITAVFFLVPFGDQGNPQANPPKPPPTTSALPKPPPEKSTTPEKPADVLIPAPEGPKHSFTGPLKPKELEGSKGGLLPEPVRDFAVTNGFVEGFFNGTVEKPQTTLLAMKMPSEDDAHGLAKSYLEGQEGLATEESLSYQGVKVVSTGGGVFRTAYTTHKWTVIIEVNSSDNAEALFTDMLDQQLEQSPPTVLK